MLVLSNTRLSRIRRLLGRGYDENVGLLLTPNNNVDMQDLMALRVPWAADNGAFSGFDTNKFLSFLTRIRGYCGCLFVACPDVVGNAVATVDMYNKWAGEILYNDLPVAFVLQDGQEDMELPDADAYFVGGSTAFKLSDSATDLIVEAKRRGAWVHMGRVNSKQRLKHAHVRGVDSVDGTRMRFGGMGVVDDQCEYVALLDLISKMRNRRSRL